MPAAHDADAMTCCHVGASGAAISANAATLNAARRAPCGRHARTVATAPTLVVVAFVTRHAAVTVRRHAIGDDSPTTPCAATEAHPASTGSQNACALRYPRSLTHFLA